MKQIIKNVCVRKRWHISHQVTNLEPFFWGGVFALYFCPHCQAFDRISTPAPGNLPSIRKKKANSQGLAWGEGRGWAKLELADALLFTFFYILLPMSHCSLSQSTNIPLVYNFLSPFILFTISKRKLAFDWGTAALKALSQDWSQNLLLQN